MFVTSQLPEDCTTNDNIRAYLHTALPTACPHTLKLLAAVTLNDVIAVKQAVRAGAGVNVHDYAGNTPLHYAAKNGIWRIALRLLTHGADPSIENFDHETAMHVALAYGKYNILGLCCMASCKDNQAARAFSQSLTGLIAPRAITSKTVLLTDTQEYQEPPTKRRKM